MNEPQRQQALYLTPGWHSTAEAAAYLGAVSDAQVYEWVATGELTAFDASKQPGTTQPHWRFRIEWIGAFLARRTKNADKAA